MLKAFLLRSSTCLYVHHPHPKEGTYSLSSYLSRLGSSLDGLPLFCLTNFVRPNTWKTKNRTPSYRQDMELCMTAIPHVSAR